MKRLFALLLTLILLTWLTATGICAEPYTITLGLSGVTSGTANLGISGSTPSPSGTSTFTITAKSELLSNTNTVLRGLEYSDTNCMWQLDGIVFPTGVTSGQAAATTGGTVSGVTINAWYKEFVINNAANIAGAQKVYIVNNLAISSAATPYQIPFYPQAMGYIMFGQDCGVSAFAINGKIKIK
uniref:Uncharacterized protein n=1 Tax=viral metagenome TaxID=1070528 RepID=A0A6M3J940_9ZZZZ